MLLISIILPCYNEELAIKGTYKELSSIMQQMGNDYEFIFVDDGSKDTTFSMLRELSLQDNCVRYIQFSRNFGKEAALLAGLQRAKGQYIVVMDVDLQDPPSLIPQMFEAVASGEYDCAGTRRITRAGEPPIRSLFARMFYSLMTKFTDIEIVDGARDFRLMSRPYVDAVLSLPERNRFSKGIFPWVGFKTKWFEYENIQRSTGETKWSFGKLFLYSLDGIIAFSSKPMAIASILGILLFLSSLFLIGFIILRKAFWGDPVAGWASTICIILFCSGIQLFTAGILGQYISKIYIEVKKRPYFIIKEEK
ncbi:MAG: putative glycosyltransferase CsbB [Candidatus Ordinivivax streblomastigis]|uniref:Putative glycosyltransferase CsbB n=1 Tax=Candidatus Ordinivivax streblomastigis TaxID=2540710 RepID=A0A5M8P4T9_9BACT|nr:MAG: putative glycosyltransferase CsbB [Candidatus Ordinivivax streblomastigis]